MDLSAYCDGMNIELREIREKIDHVMMSFDKAPCADKSKVLPYFNQLYIMAIELDDRISELKTECPTDWTPQKADLERRMNHLSRNWDKLWETVSPGDIGG